MTPLGKPLVFYLKYMAEMNRLYDPLEEGERPDLIGLEDAQHVREMVRTVGAAAYEQAADFLESCGREVENHFNHLGATFSGRARRSYVLRNWSWEVRVHVPSVTGGWFNCGVWITAPPEIHVSLPQNVCGVVVPWLWSKGGRKGADAVWEILKGKADSRAGAGLTFASGTVALSRIDIQPQPPESFDVDRDPLVAEVTKAIERIGAKEMEAIVRFVAGIRESDEG